MSTAPHDLADQPLPPTRSFGHWSELPARLHALLVDATGESQAWLSEAFDNDSATQVKIEPVTRFAAALARLREERFDAVLISVDGPADATYDFLEAVRATDEFGLSVVVLDRRFHASAETMSLEAGADAYLNLPQTTTRTLLWRLGRVIQHRRLLSENRQLRQAQQHRLRQEHDEAERLLNQQRGMIEGLEKLQPGPAPRLGNPIASPFDLAADDSSTFELSPIKSPGGSPPPESLVAHYGELLRAYVMMGSGNLTGEMSRLAELLAQSGVSSQRVMSLHLHVLEEMVRGLGSRSARHVMTRADMLILEVMIHLAEGYRRRGAADQAGHQGEATDITRV